nr:MAG TPA: Protein of unknown function (DUF1700) [Crassvirales sp.]
MNKESKLKARRTKLGKCSKEELIERIIRKDTEVSKLIAKNKSLNKELFEADELLNDIKNHYENKVKFLNVDYDEVVEKNLSLQKGFKTVLVGLLVTSALFVITLVVAFLS